MKQMLGARVWNKPALGSWEGAEVFGRRDDSLP